MIFLQKNKNGQNLHLVRFHVSRLISKNGQLYGENLVDTSHEIGVLVACAYVEMGFMLHLLEPSDSTLT